MTTKTLITSRDPKGLHAVGLFESTYNKAGLDESKAQRLNENGGEFQTELKKLIERFSESNQFAKEVVNSKHTYPNEYKILPIAAQIAIIGETFGLSTDKALEYVKTLPALPEGSEGWFAIPSFTAIAQKHFPAITDPAEQYCMAVNYALEKLAASRSFYNYRAGEIIPKKLQQHARTVSMMEEIQKVQTGAILIIAGQLGLRHRGKSVRRARETFAANEFGLGALAVISIVLVYPQRLVRWEELDLDCAGDEFSPDGDGSFSEAPHLYFGGGRAGFDAGDVSEAGDHYGSASGFVPKYFCSQQKASCDAFCASSLFCIHRRTYPAP